MRPSKAEGLAADGDQQEARRVDLLGRRIDAEATPQPTPLQGPRVTAQLRHQCRFCRTKLVEPTDNWRKAFCCRGCHTSYYRSRCLVCEGAIRRKSERQRVCYAAACKSDLRRFP